MNELVKMTKIILLIFCFSGFNAAASSNVGVEYRKPLRVEVGATGINRISFAPHIVTNIWGDSGEYSATLSGNGHELFLTSKKEKGSITRLAVSLAGGRIIDLILHVSAVDPKIVSLDIKPLTSEAEKQEKEIMNMLSFMREGLGGKYYIKKHESKIQIKSHDAVFAYQKKLYRFKNLIGIPLNLKNESKKLISIDIKKLLDGFKDVVALQIDEIKLKPKQATKVFLVLTKTEI